MISNFRENKGSYLVIGGAEGRVYWFRFQKYPKRLYGSEIPRYTAEDTAKAITEVLDENILPDVKFSALAKNKISGAMTPLPEHVYKRWHFHRLMTIGDAAHKVRFYRHSILLIISREFGQRLILASFTQSAVMEATVLSRQQPP